MMREIKFRAWDETRKKFIKGDMSNVMLGLSGMTFWQFGDGLPEPVPGKYPLQQYTGLKDKNGVEIYEGDILKGFTEYSGRSNRGKLVPKVAEVFWCDENAAWSVYPMFFQWRREDSQLEVIGNIYENSDLLKENPQS